MVTCQIRACWSLSQKVDAGRSDWLRCETNRPGRRCRECGVRSSTIQKNDRGFELGLNPERAGWTCKPGFVSAVADGGHLSSPHRGPKAMALPHRGETASPPGSSSQPGDGPDAHSPPIWPCSRWGLAAAASPQTAGRSYRPISPLSRSESGRYVSVPLSVPDQVGTWALPSTLPRGARTFLPSSLARKTAVTQSAWPSCRTLA